MTQHILIESLCAVDAAHVAGVGADVTWHASSPGIVETLRLRGERVFWIEDCLDRDPSDGIGHVTFEAVEALSRELLPIASELEIPCMITNAARQLHMLIGTLLYKQILLSEWSRKYHGGIVIGGPRLTTSGAGNIGYHRFDTLFSILAAHPVNGLKVIEHYARRPEETEFKDVPSVLTRFLSWADFSLDQLLWRWLRYGARGRQIQLGATDARVIIMRENEVIREILPHLMFRGVSLELLPPIEATGPQDPYPALPTAYRVEQCLTAVDDLGVPKAPIAAAIHELLIAASRFWRPLAALTKTHVDALAIDNRPTVLMSSAVPGFAGVALLAAVRKHGGRVILVEHGVSAGLSAFHLAFRRRNEAQFGEVYLVCSENTQKFLEAEPKFRHVSVCSIGLADSVRNVRLRPVQRWLARRKAHVSRERVVLYLARPEQNNFRWLPSHDRDLHDLQKRIAFSVLPRVRGRGIFKTYPSQRFLDPMPIGQVMALPESVGLIDRGDFRFIRAVADVILVESLMSTIGFAFGAGVPIVFLRQKGVDPLPKVEEALKRSIFFADTRRAGWEDALVEFLNRPEAILRAEWDAKAPAREAFVRQCISGPDHAGRNGAALVLESMRRCAPQKVAPQHFQ